MAGNTIAYHCRQTPSLGNNSVWTVPTGYHAHLDPIRTGRGFDVIVNVDLATKDRATVSRFGELDSHLTMKTIKNRT
jgi:hypothetical protein